MRYFRNSGLSTIMCHGSLGEVQRNLMITTTSMKIGRGRKKCCVCHSLKEKSFVIFKVESGKASMHVKVLYNLPLHCFNICSLLSSQKYQVTCHFLLFYILYTFGRVIN